MLDIIPHTIALYTLTWVLKIATDLYVGVLKTKKSVHWVVYLLINFVNKFHLMFFTMIIMDITFYGVRTVLHTSYSVLDFWRWINFWVCYAIFIMVGIDISRIFQLFINLKVDEPLKNFHQSSLAIKKLHKEEFVLEQKRKKLNADINTYYVIDHKTTL